MDTKNEPQKKDRHAKKQNNYRLSEAALTALDFTANKRDWNRTQVIEACIALYARDIQGLGAECADAIYRILSRRPGMAPSSLAKGCSSSTDSVASVAKSLGNSESILKRHYDGLATKSQAAEFWQLPKKYIDTYGKSATSGS